MNPQFVNPEDVTATMPQDVFDRSQALQAERQKTIEGLPTFGETMYRSTADIIGTPVDLASMALAPFGYDEKAPIGGSEYFKQMGEQKGIISSASNPILEIASSLMIPDPLDVLTVSKMATPMLLGMVGEGVAGMMKKPSSVGMVLEQAAAMDGKQANKFLNENINMRDLTPEDKQKVIDFRRGVNVPKAKAPKQEAAILAAEFSEATRGVYSKLEDEIEKISDSIQFKTDDEVIKYLLDKGVTKAEIEGSKITEHIGHVTEGAELKQVLKDYQRPDVLEKKSIFEQTETTMEYDDWENDYVTVGQTDRTSVGESGVGWRVTDDRTGRKTDIRLSYDDDRYIDDSGYEYDYVDMQDDWFENYSDDYEDAARELATDNDEIWEELSDAERKDYTISAAEDDSPWYDYYQSKEVYETEYGQTFDTLEEAEEAIKEGMYEDYRDYADEGETFEGYTVSGGDNYDMEIYRMPEYKPEGGKWEHEEPHLKDMANWQEDYENVAFHIRKKDRTDSEGGSGTVLEELQSQWEQDWRSEGGGKAISTPEERVKIEDTINKYGIKNTQLKTERQDLKKEWVKLDNDLNDFATNNPSDTEGIVARSKKLDENLDKQSRLSLQITENDTSITREKNKLKEPSLGAPPLAKRTQYEKVALMDQLKTAVDSDKDFFGFINGHIQNGSFKPTTKGMIQAYDVELPRITQRLTGQKPYMASFKDGSPINYSGESGKVHWDAKKAAEGDYYQNIADDKNLWYWKVDLTPEVKERLKKSKTQLYTHPATVGAVGLGVGAGAMYGEEEEGL